MKKVPVLIPFLVFVSAVFIGILIWAYVETKKANPQMIEVGKVVSTGSGHSPDRTVLQPGSVCLRFGSAGDLCRRFRSRANPHRRQRPPALADFA